MPPVTQRLNSPDARQPSGVLEFLAILWARRFAILLSSVTVSAAAYAATYLITPTYTASTSFLPPQTSQSAASSALASLGAIAGIAGAATVKTPADQYIGLMQSATVLDRVAAKFSLASSYGLSRSSEVRAQLSKRLSIIQGKKDGIIYISAEDEDPNRAAEIASQLVEELKILTSSLAVSEAQQRRVFFEQQLSKTKSALASAQAALAATGFNESALRAEPRAASEEYLRTKAELTALEVQAVALSSRMTSTSPESQSLQLRIRELRDRLQRSEKTGSKSPAASDDYVTKYREFKYQEALFEIYARQFEIARVDESREGALIQVVDAATAPDRRSKPQRLQIAGMAWVLAFFVFSAWFSAKTILSRSSLE